MVSPFLDSFCKFSKAFVLLYCTCNIVIQSYHYDAFGSCECEIFTESNEFILYVSIFHMPMPIAPTQVKNFVNPYLTIIWQYSKVVCTLDCSFISSFIDLLYNIVWFNNYYCKPCVFDKWQNSEHIYSFNSGIMNFKSYKYMEAHYKTDFEIHVLRVSYTGSIDNGNQAITKISQYMYSFPEIFQILCYFCQVYLRRISVWLLRWSDQSRRIVVSRSTSPETVVAWLSLAITYCWLQTDSDSYPPPSSTLMYVSWSNRAKSIER